MSFLFCDSSTMLQTRRPNDLTTLRPHDSATQRPGDRSLFALVPIDHHPVRVVGDMCDQQTIEKRVVCIR